ncbi:MAG TPA: MgtC/SapB family protein, partial [Candidatus Acidoferrales bacterium]|nr:MgtC/SapB family protein [Candidatus Acidoferrales bacterium]
TRIVSNLIPGIGFIGAGAIIRERGSVVGLTTAATVFVVASMGMAVGAGLYLTASFAGLLILLALSLLGWAEDRLSLKTRALTFRVTTPHLEEAMARTSQLLKELNVAMEHFRVFHVGKEFVMEFDAEVSYNQQHELISRLSALGLRSEVMPLEAQRE